MTRFGVMRHIGVLERAGLEWYRVIAVEPLKSMDLCGQLASRYGGPATSLLHLSLETTSDGVETILQLTDSVLGRVSPQLTDSVTSGWQASLRDGLKRHIEHGRSRAQHRQHLIRRRPAALGPNSSGSIGEIDSTVNYISGASLDDQFLAAFDLEPGAQGFGAVT